MPHPLSSMVSTTDCSVSRARMRISAFSVGRVGDGVGENLLDHEGRPLHVGEDAQLEILDLELYPPLDERARMAPDRWVDDRLEAGLSDKEVPFDAVASRVEERLLDQIFGALDLGEHVVGRSGGVVLRDELRRGNRRLDLVHPQLDVLAVLRFALTVEPNLVEHRLVRRTKSFVGDSPLLETGFGDHLGHEVLALKRRNRLAELTVVGPSRQVLDRRGRRRFP